VNSPAGAGRRAFLERMAAASAGALLDGPSVARRRAARPVVVAVASGDVDQGRAIVWGQCDRTSRLVVEYATTEGFADPRRVLGSTATRATDYTARVDLSALPAGQRIFYRVRFQDLADPRAVSEPLGGRFRTAPVTAGGVSFAWGGDVAGQGWGIDRDRGGYAIFDALRRAEPDVFIHSGDAIYADNPLKAEVSLDDGSVWRNLVTPAKSKVAETLDEFRGNYRYNLMDDHLRAFQAETPWTMQWDDHEVMNNWYPGQIHDDARYRVKDVSLLAARAKQAFLEYAPLRPAPGDSRRIYRKLSYGPSLDVFVLDLRTYRGANSPNRQARLTPAARILGAAQTAWLKSALAASRATWKLIACDMPLGITVADGPRAFEAVANGDPGPPLGRELEIADILQSASARGVRNLVFVTADVHYAAAHQFDPGRASVRGFRPFWEFIAGPLHAGTFFNGDLDPTFGPEVLFRAVGADMKPNRPPSDGLQFFGKGTIAPGSEVLTVSLHDRTGRELYSVDLPPER
jgi:alkaline phosphatase D